SATGDWSYTFTAAGAIKSIHAVFETAALAGSRIPSWQLADAAGNVIWRGIAPAVEAPNSSEVYMVFNGAPWQQANMVGEAPINYLPLPPDLVVLPGWVLSVTTLAI